ncbi:MAG: universal stress protein [Pirellulaceae bacterium]
MNVLLATDGSDDAVHAANFLMTLQFKESVSLTVLTTSYAPDRIDSATSQAWFPQWREIEDARVSKHHDEVRQLLASLDENMTMLQVDGSAAHEILSCAKQIDADLIVIGARGHSAIGRVLLGSVSDSVATHAECSVLVVRPEIEGTADDACTCRLTLAYDASESSAAAVEELKHFDWPQCSTVNILNVVTSPAFIMSEYPVLLQDHTDQAVTEARLACEKLLSELSADIKQPTSQVAVGDHVGETIIGNAKEAGSNLIMMGDTGRGFLGTLMLGSISKYVLRHADCSVWISRHHRKNGSQA